MSTSEVKATFAMRATRYWRTLDKSQRVKLSFGFAFMAFCAALVPVGIYALYVHGNKPTEEYAVSPPSNTQSASVVRAAPTHEDKMRSIIRAYRAKGGNCGAIADNLENDLDSGNMAFFNRRVSQTFQYCLIPG